MNGTAHWPREVRLNKEKNVLTVSFDNDQTFSYSAEYLRVHSPSAEVQGHSPDQRKTVGFKAKVKIADIEAIGNYAIRLVYDDTHDTGIYSWSYLYELGRDHDANWQNYLRELEEKGLARG